MLQLRKKILTHMKWKRAKQWFQYYNQERFHQPWKTGRRMKFIIKSRNEGVLHDCAAGFFLHALLAHKKPAPIGAVRFFNFF
jgi:hypothetical protein